jgi:hypothetical protein
MTLTRKTYGLVYHPIPIGQTAGYEPLFSKTYKRRILAPKLGDGYDSHLEADRENREVEGSSPKNDPRR